MYVEYNTLITYLIVIMIKFNNILIINIKINPSLKFIQTFIYIYIYIFFFLDN